MLICITCDYTLERTIEVHIGAVSAGDILVQAFGENVIVMSYVLVLFASFLMLDF